MKRYIKLPIEEFLHDSVDKWDKDLADLNQKREEILFLKGMTNSEVHSGSISHITEDTALLLAANTEEQERIYNYRASLDKALEWLDEDEEKLIDGFFFNKNKRTINAFVDEYCIEHECEKSTVYNRKRMATEKLRKLIEEMHPEVFG